jgi:hypothetical protein
MGYLRQLVLLFLRDHALHFGAMAAEIRTSPYNYTYGKAAANSTDQETFVICELCPPRQIIALKPRMTALVVRVPEAAASITADGPPTENRLPV